MKPKATPRKRGRAGQVDRLRRLKRTNGLCELCLAEGRTRLATVVDHIKPLDQGGPDTDANTRNLCDPHDKAKTAEQFGLTRSKGLGGCNASGIPTDPDHPWSQLARAGR